MALVSLLFADVTYACYWLSFDLDLYWLFAVTFLSSCFAFTVIMFCVGGPVRFGLSITFCSWLTIMVAVLLPPAPLYFELFDKSILGDFTFAFRF